MAFADNKVIIEAPPEKVYKVISDFKTYPDYVSGMKKTTILDKKGEKYKVEFEVKVIKSIKYTLELKGKPGKELTWTLIDGFFKKNDGGWKLKKLKDGSTEAYYFVDLEFGFMVPKYIEKKLIESNFPKMLKEVKERVESI